MKIVDINSLGAGDFVALLGGIYEHSPWVAERAEPRRPFASVHGLALALREEVERAAQPEKLALLRAHPDLGTRAKVSLASAGEQAGAGLDRLAPEQYDALMHLNRSYREKFDFPFIFAVKGSGPSDILIALRIRLDSTRDAEFNEALGEVHKIAGFRLLDLIEEH